MTAREAGNGTAYRAAADDRGVYAFPDCRRALRAGGGPQRICAVTGSGLEVTSDAALRIDIVLALGEHSEAVTVNESPVQVESASTQLGER